MNKNPDEDLNDYTIKELALDVLKYFPFLHNLFMNKEPPIESKREKVTEEVELLHEDYADAQVIGKNKNHGLDNGLGYMKFVLKYESPKGVLKVIIQKAEELVGKDPRGSSDPYCLVSFVPPVRENCYKTMVKKKTLSPIWNHVFVFYNFSEIDLKKHRLRIVLFDWDKYGTHESLGEVYYELSKLINHNGTNNRSINWSEQSKNRNGKIVETRSDNTGSSNALSDTSSTNKEEWINAWLLDDTSECSTLKYDDRISCHSSLFNEEDRLIVMTSASMIPPNENQDPNELTSDEGDDNYYDELDDDNDKLTKMPLSASSVLKKDEMFINKEHEMEDQSELLYDNDEKCLLRTTKVENEASDIYDEINEKLQKFQEIPRTLEKTNRTLSNEERAVVRRIEVIKYLSPLPNSRSKFGELFISLNYDIRMRQLVVTIVKARNMIDPSRRSLIPYCTLRHILITKDREKTKSHHRTSYRYYTSTPVWNESFLLNVTPEKLKLTAIEIQVFHSTKSSKMNDELLGIIRLGLKAYQKQRKHWTEFLSSIGVPVSTWHDIRL